MKSVVSVPIMMLSLVMSVQVSRAATHYIRSGAAGNGNGSDWTNACTDFTGSCGTLVRGDVYYVATGSYGGLTVGTAVSGTSLIVVKGATAADHGTSTGWNSSFGVDVTQAFFSTSGGLAINTSYVTFDGNTGDPSVSDANMGFAFNFGTGNCGTDINPVDIGDGSNVSNVTISHLELFACSGDVQKEAITEHTTGSFNSIHITYNRFDGVGAPTNGWQVNVFAIDDTGLIFDHNVVIGAWSTSSHHGGPIDFLDNVQKPIISNNVFINCAGTACIEANDTGTTCSGGLNGAQIFGNVITDGGTDNAVIGPTTRCYVANTAVYNNTIVTNSSSPAWFMGCVSGAATCSSAIGNAAENNIVYAGNCGPGSNVQTEDYNSYFACSAGTSPSESHGQIANSTPFVNVAANNYKLAVDTSLWNASGIPAGDNMDPNQVKRTSSRGAYQFSGTALPQPPSKLGATVN